MNYDEHLQLEIDALGYEIKNPLLRKYLIYARSKAEDEEIKRSIVACLAWLNVEKEMSRGQEINN